MAKPGKGGNMFDEHRRPAWRLFYLLAIVLVGVCWGQSPATTTISDVVYRADGTLAGGTLLISWPTFSTSSGQAVAAGRKSVTLGAGGTLSVALVPNTGSTPAGTFYTVVYQLDDGTVKTEFWIVPATSPATIAAVRTLLGSGSSAVLASGSGSFVSKAGDSMTGPLQLPGDPVAPNQAADKHYVDSGLAVKADVISGVVPSGQLGNGVANSGVCLHGDSSWEACGSSSNAVSIQNVPVDTTAPSDNEVITYVASSGKYEPRAGSGVTAGMAATKYSSDFNWSQSPSTSLSTAGAKAVNLPACVAGVLGSEPQYYVYVAGAGTPEAVLVTGGTCNGDGQPGRVRLVEERVTQLEKSEIRRGVYDRIVNAVITVAISAAIAMHDRW
ncbi:MAG TPA: hypothetical protein VEU11_09200, partial [Terriglobales bacterium]|nr:hypothetical protein [Terriglobales bacterium]